MLNRIIGFSIRNKLIIGILILGLIGYGTYQFTRLPIDAVPDITNNQVLVITTSPSLGAGDIERLITFPIEQATRNIPGIIEQRSFSRFGLSLVTIVFDDGTDVYWARQQVTERLAQVSIDKSLGTPTLGPVTTGLGEIYQYVIRPKPGYETKYNAMELRSIQDWIVRKQLLGIPGVADVSSFGGELKQYEVAVNLDKLKAAGTSINEVFDALEKNNSNTGGAYIEKGPAILFIRSEGLVKSVSDIASVLIKTLPDGTPLTIGHVAEVRFDAATRYGAICYNDQGEVAGALVMMLKGENSSAVIKAVKKRIDEISKTLPEGVMIEPFLDRTKMVNNAIGTVEKNLIEGALIVVFILVLFLGNFRAGFLVASVIPLSMLFAVIMMNLFGVSGNLMSLGALDFGLIVDGAVIIVEAVMHRLHHNKKFAGLTAIDQSLMDEEVKKSSGKMMNAAVFGQMIILIVYLPILTLEGIEGKMFRPMAETVAFAILGAFILSLTYVPMMSALFLSKKIKQQPTFSDRMIRVLEQHYQNILQRAMTIPRIVVGSSVVLLIASFFILNSLGGEFIPKLEEGDFAVDTRVLTGSSLHTTIESTQKAAHLLLKNYPEVEKIVTKIGSGEIPTDPMPIEASDMMIILKPKKEWTSAKSFDELAEKMSKTLEDVPGITAGFQYPVQMRFNELMTGGRQDVVCKIFGEDLDTLSSLAEKLGAIAAKVDGATDLYVESVTGLPQIVVKYKRDALAQFGISIDEVNRTLQAAFAGTSAGMVYENERRFDLVVRLANQDRRDLSDVQKLLVATANGNQVPLHMLADLNIEVGPNQIQRDDAQRRITVGFNVRGRDVESVVSELQRLVANELDLPDGNYITYGGSFENLRAAKNRLAIAVPISLLLILLLLYFAFNSLSQSLLVYSAIPLSAIGGVLALWTRGLPFSISAGIGFIALFGVAVLNGIVLITEFNQLKASGVSDVNERILKGTRIRLRPVLMTALVASLGFLPMALSEGAGAEVQRPLATVVIGGLVTATILTLLVLPVLYRWFDRDEKNKKTSFLPKALRNKFRRKIIPLTGLSSCLVFFAQAQQPVSLQAALDSAAKNNRSIQAATLRSKAQMHARSAAINIAPTALSWEQGEMNSEEQDNKIALSQDFHFPLVYVRQRQLLQAHVDRALAEEGLLKAHVRAAVMNSYLRYAVLKKKETILTQQDSIFRLLLDRQQERLNAGEVNALEFAVIKMQHHRLNAQMQSLMNEKQSALQELNRLVNNSFPVLPDEMTYRLPMPDTNRLPIAKNQPAWEYREAQTRIAQYEWKKEQSSWWPQFNVGFSSQTMKGYLYRDGSQANSGDRFNSITAGIRIPLFANTVWNEARASKWRFEASRQESNEQETVLHDAVDAALLRLKIAARNLQIMDTETLTQAEQMVRQCQLQMEAGAINAIEWSTLMQQQLEARLAWLEALNLYNTAAIDYTIMLNP